MNHTLSTAILAVTLAIPGAGAFADQPFGRDSVYSSARSQSTSTPASTVRNEAQPNGRDTVSAARLPGAGQSGASTVEVTLKPGRA